MTITNSTIGNLKMVIRIFILMNFNLRRRIKIHARPRFLNFQEKFIIGNLSLSCFIREMSFLSIACRIWIAIYHLKYFIFQLVRKFCVLSEQQQTWLICWNELIFCWYEWKSKVTNVPVSFHYWKRYLGNTLKYFISFWKKLSNFLRFILCKYLYACPRMFLDVCVSI